MKHTVWILNTHSADAAAFSGAVAGLERDALARVNGAWQERIARRTAFSRALLRHAVAALVKEQPRDVRLEERTGGPPVAHVTGGASIHLSLTHTGTWIACIVSLAGPVGIDIEDTSRARDLRAIASWGFAEAECRWIAAQPDSEIAFYQLWTGKEATFKLAHEHGGPTHPLAVKFTPTGDHLPPPSPAKQIAFSRLTPTLACSIATATAEPLPLIPDEIRWLDPALFASSGAAR